MPETAATTSELSPDAVVVEASQAGRGTSVASSSLLDTPVPGLSVSGASGSGAARFVPPKAAVVGDAIGALRDAIMRDDDNAHFTALGWEPVFTASPASRILLVGQAPGRKAQESGIPWNDPSGDTLLGWLGIDRACFHDPDAFAIVPMDFYFPGKSGSGDAPPRRAFADRWHKPLLELLPQVRLTILAGAHAQKYYLPKPPKGSLSVTETVRSWRDHAPAVVPIVHPSPLTIGWRARNPWFEGELVPELRTLVAAALAG